MPEDKNAPLVGAAGNVVLLKDDKSVVKALENVTASLEEWREIVVRGFMAELLELLLNMFQAIRRAPSEKQVNDACGFLIASIVDTFESLEAAPFGSPNLDGIRLLGEELSGYRTRATDTNNSQHEMESELGKRNEQILSLGRQLGELQGKHKALETQYQELRQLDHGRLERLSHQLGGMNKTLHDSLIQPEQNATLAEALQHLGEELSALGKKKQENAETQIQSMQALLATLERTARTITLGQADPLIQINSDILDPFQISQEIVRRRGFLEKVSNALTAVEEQYQRLRDEMPEVEWAIKTSEEQERRRALTRQWEILSQLKKLDLLTQGLLDTEKGCREKIAKLENYQRSITVISGGIPRSVFDEQLIEPLIPKVAPKTVGEGSEEGVPRKKPAKFQFDEQRYRRVTELAERHGLNAKMLMMVTLYEVFAQKTGEAFRARKGNIPLLTAAKIVGVLPAFGWDSPKAVLGDWPKQDSPISTVMNRYLKFSGKSGRSNMYFRTSEKLPWSPQEVLESAEAADFLDQLEKHLEEEPKE